MKPLRVVLFCLLPSAFCLLLSAFCLGSEFPRGAARSPAHHLLAAPTHRVSTPPPAQCAYVPAKLDMWGNDQYGDCVTAEEAFAKACYCPEIFVSSDTAVDWARRHGYLHGADLASVLQTMGRDGFRVGPQQYDDGAYASVDYSSQVVLQSAIAAGPVKIAIDADALPSGAGNQQGFYTTDCGQKYPNTDHCVSLCGYGSAEYLYSQLRVPLPAALPADTQGYLLYTWSTIGFVTHDWLMTTCAEAWVRTPTTVGNPPLAPTPAPPAPGPTPDATTSLTFSEAVQLAVAASGPNLSAAQAAAVSSFFADDNSPRVNVLKELIYRRGLAAGVIPAGTPIAAVNWQNLVKTIVELEPLIVPLIPLLFGEAEQRSSLAAPVSLCAVEAPPKKEKPAVKKPVPVPVPKYRKECGPDGCRLVPVDQPRIFKLFRSR